MRKIISKLFLLFCFCLILLVVDGCNNPKSQLSQSEENSEYNNPKPQLNQSEEDSEYNNPKSQLNQSEENSEYDNPKPQLYQLEGDSQYNIENVNKVNKFIYGYDNIGIFNIKGDIVQQEMYNEYSAYGVGDVITFEYNYNGNFHTDNEESWNIYSDDQKIVAGIELDKKVREGVIIIQKSVDGISWENAIEPIYDAFEKSNEDKSVFYTTSLEEIMQGTYYRIFVAYAMRKQTSIQDSFLFLKDKVYESRNFVEKYEFYICSDKNYIEIKEVITKNSLDGVSSVEHGFYIEKNGSSDDIEVKCNSQSWKVINDYESFTEPGLYNIEISTKLGKKYNYMITISKGFYSLYTVPTIYECKKGEGFEGGVEKTNGTSFGIKSYSTLQISQNAEFITTKSTYKGFDAYGINGDTVRIFLKLNYSLELNETGWNVVKSTWGKEEKQQVCGVYTGEIGTGTLIIQTSATGKEGEWVNVDKSKYSSGLYTTDYGTNYAANEDVLIYTPDGDEILSGMYVRILYAYQVYQKSEKEYIDCLEKYEFYLCSNELGAVTFHNLSLEKQKEETYGEQDENIMKVYKQTETLPSGSGTVTGFSIDTTLNPTVTYSVVKNGKSISAPKDNKFITTGKYDIHLLSAVGDVQTVTIYVDTSSKEEALMNYFGEGFINGKRIYAEEEYPVYEAGKTFYNLESVGEEYLPISGTIKNMDTGEEIELGVSREARSGVISSAGNYVATFVTGMKKDESKIGDTREFIFKFRIIAEGTAPGPRLNQKLLEEYRKTNISDVYPIYYGITYQSAAKGYITLAFKNKEDAINYAYSYEKGMVEQQRDGTYRYNGSFSVGQKEKFDSAWTLTDAMYYFAEQAVQKAYFDLADEFTFITLEEDIIENTSNLRTLELNNSVVIFADGQRELLNITQGLPIISEKTYAYIEPGLNGKKVTGVNDYEFLKDKNGYDSNSVQIKDCNGKVYDIKYNKGVGEQLKIAGCPSGVVTITESTVYGDSISYEAIYIHEGDNTARVTLSYYDDGQEKQMILSSENNGLCLETDVFSIEQVVDELTPVSLVLISKEDQLVAFYGSDQKLKEVWEEAGKYNIRIVNTLGYDFSFDVIVRESAYSEIVFN